MAKTEKQTNELAKNGQKYGQNMANKLTPEEILEKAGYNEDAIFISYETVVKYMQKYAEQFHKEKMREEAILFANWLDKLTPSQKVSVWSKDGQYSGLFTMDNEQLFDKYLKTKQ